MSVPPPPQPHGGSPGGPSPYAQHGPYAPPPGPYGHPGPAGGPSGGPPGGPRGNNSGRLAAFAVVAGVLALMMVAWIVWEAYDSDDGSSGPSASVPSPTSEESMGPVYKLSLPDKLQGGRYTLTRDLTGETEQDRPRDTDFAKQLVAKAGVYSAAGGDGGEFIFQGLSSAKRDPSFPRFGMLDGMTDDSGVKIAVRRRIFATEGGKLACEVHSKPGQDGQGRGTFPLCSWIDPHTQGIVLDSTAATQRKAPGEVDLEALAEKAAKVRDEVRVPAE